MGLTSLQVCMDSSDWLQTTIPEESAGMDSSSPSGDNILTCSRPLIERRLRPPHDQLALKCPRCDSTHTKFCYYNNYSLSQPRYFCKTCRRYWTKGGTLRNIPVGGGCRKNKKVSSSKKSNIHDQQNLGSSSSTSSISSPTALINNPTCTDHLQLSFHDHQMQFSHLSNILGNNHPNHFMLQNPLPIDFMESKYEGLVGSSSSRNHDFLGNGDMGFSPSGIINSGHENFHNFCSPFGMSIVDGNYPAGGSAIMVPYEAHEDQINGMEVKPNAKLLSLEWHDDQQGSCSDAGKDSFGYYNGVGSAWPGLMMNGYGTSAPNPLV
ncbi:hypothetical protein ACH5RR_025559 [Cinchona calisaya]|uniref:Dof zinc finger protein n=1 Tax=Cinchona calisaya TaxID=153742 RepID=A0ABD2Z363_9GENT